MRKFALFLMISLMVALEPLQAKIILRATELNDRSIAEILKMNSEEVIVEFRKSDEIPLVFKAEGDLLETTHPAINYVTVKKDFWIKLVGNDLQISFDNNQFKNISEVLTGSIQAGAGLDQNLGVANSINILFRALKKQ